MNPIRSRFEGARRTLREDSTLQAVLKHTGWLTGSSGGIFILAALQGVLTGRLLGVEVWGMLGVAISFSMVTSRLLSFRMHEFVTKWVTEFLGDGTPRAATVFKLALVGDVGSALISFAIVELLAGWGAAAFAKNPDFAWAFRALALTIVFQAGQESLIGMLHVHRDFRVESLIQTGTAAVSLCGVAVVFLMGGSVRGVVGVLVGAAAVSSVLMWTFGLRAARAVLEPGWMRQKVVGLGELRHELARFALLGNLSGTLSSVMNDGDLLVLGFLRSPVEVGYYKLAKSLAQIAYLPVTPLAHATYPEFSAAAAAGQWDKFRSLMRRGSKVMAFWLVPVSVGLVLVGWPAIALLYGPSFVPAVPALAILLVGIVIDGVLFWTRITLLSMGEPGYPTAVNAWMTGAKYALAFLLVPVGGYLMLAALHSLALAGMNALTARRTLSRLRIRESMPDA